MIGSKVGFGMNRLTLPPISSFDPLAVLHRLHAALA